jgi:hypothetical protein
MGERVATLLDERSGPGERTLFWNASREASGIYYCRLIAGEHVTSRAVRVRR